MEVDLIQLCGGVPAGQPDGQFLGEGLAEAGLASTRGFVQHHYPVAAHNGLVHSLVIEPYVVESLYTLFDNWPVGRWIIVLPFSPTSSVWQNKTHST